MSSRPAHSVIVLGIFLLSAFAFGQSKRVINLEAADSLVGRVIDGKDARELVGHVRIRQDSVRLTCDRALEFPESGEVFLYGNVLVRDDSVTMAAPRAIYHRDARQAEAFDSVRLDDGKVLLTAGYGQYDVDSGKAFFHTNVVVRDTGSTSESDTLTYYRDRRNSLAVGRVVLTNRTDNVTIGGGVLLDEGRGRYSRMTVRPVLVQVDTAGSAVKDTFVVRSATLESFSDSLRRLVATDSVRINRADLAATAERAVFFTDADSITLRGSPVIWYGVTQVSGDSINVYLKKRALSRVTVMGDGFALSRSDSAMPDRIDQLTGETLDMFFEDRRLARITADTRAISVYHLYEDSLANGLNRSSGDRIIMEFEEGRLASIKIVGGVEGEYVPEPQLKNKEEEYRLPGFQWRKSRPTVRKTELPWNSRRPTQK
jgi:lipopolysaccharide export system protein LptA